LLWYLLWYKTIDKSAKSLPDEHKKLATIYSDEIIQTYWVRMAQLVQNAIVYKSIKNWEKLLSRLNKDIVQKVVNVDIKIWIKFAGRTVTLENYTKMITATAEQTAKVNGIINKWVQEWIMRYRRVEKIDSKTCKTCRGHHWEIWDVSKQWIPPSLYHPFCRWYREAII
jgi:hypothetical protein